MVNTSLLIVEDENIVAIDIKEKAKSMGYKVVGIASSGEEAVELAGNKKPDLVIMDIVLKGKMDGIEAAEIIKRDHDIPIIYLTAYADDETLKRAKLTGPLGYLIKPFEERELHTAIEVALYNHMIKSKLKTSEERYRKLVETSPDAVLLINHMDKILFANKTVEKFTGFPRRELIGKEIKALRKIGILKEEEFNKFMENLINPFREHLEPIEFELNDREGNKHYLEFYTSVIKTKDESLLQIIGHDITDRIEAEKKREELIREKSKAELYGFLVSAFPVFASTIPPRLRNAIIKNFADKFEKNLKPTFEEHMERVGLLTQINENRIEDDRHIFRAYISWLSSFLENLGIKTKIIKKDENRYHLEFVTFPWTKEARRNPIFSLIFRTILMRSFTWTQLKGGVIQISTFSDKKNIKFEFHLGS